MKYIITIIFVFIIYTAVTSAQTEWYTQNSGTNNFLFDVHFTDQNSGWVCGQGGIILHTSDGGINWETQDPPPSNYYSGIHFVDDQNGWSVGYAGRIIHTSDGGNNWFLQATPTQYSISDLYFIDANTGWTVGGKARTFTDPVREILHTTDGGSSWSIQYSGSNEDPLGTVYFVDENNGWAVGSMSTIMQTTDGGNNWSIQMSGTGYEFTDVYFINSDTGWVVGQDLSVQHFAVIFKTIDGGTTWDYQTFGSGDSFTGIQFVNDTEGWVVGGTNTETIILHTTDGGANWTPDNPGTSNFLSGLHFVDENNGWAVGFNGTIIHTDNIVPVELSAFAAKVIKDNVKLIWETSTETNNSGFEIQRSDKSGSYRQIGFVPGHGTSLETQKYSFTDKNVPAGNYSYRLVQLDLDGTRNNSESVKIEIAGSYPYEYKLFQNFPNPFNPATLIKYSIPAEGKVKLRIFNSIGEEITTLVNEFKQAGNYEVNYNAAGLASGVYYYRLETDNFVSMKKMILLK
jgi:photosystem II stability/assembly factor-like uncharacterized protein